MTMIGLAGYAQSGKDTVGGILVEEYGFERVAFADKLRACALALDPLIPYVSHSHNSRVRLSWLINAIGWEDAKVMYPEVRRLLQVLGTEVGRDLIYPNVWVDAVCRDLHPGVDYVFTDVRFPNEAERIQDMGGSVWRIDRTGTRPVNPHASETALDEWVYDYVVFNTGTLDNLAYNVGLGLALETAK